VRRMLAGLAATTLVSAGLAGLGTPAEASTSTSSKVGSASLTRYVVLYAEGSSQAAGRAAVKAAGGTLVSDNASIGVATVESRDPQFRAKAGRQSALAGVAADRVIGRAPKDKKASADAPAKSDIEKSVGARSASKGAAAQKTTRGKTPASTADGSSEPLASRQWDMRQIDAFAAQREQAGDKRVKVGIIDTGVDGSHPDIAPNFDKADSRNFVTDIPEDAEGTTVDGPCEYSGCVDPADHDDNGHGTHVASTIGAAVNGVGIAGVAPNVTLVNLRAGQDSGYFFLQPTVDAITYAGTSGVDVVNMSFYTDPWLFNCASNPADSPQEQQDQRTVIAATQRAVNFAHQNGVTLVAASGNENTDLGDPGTDTTSPDYPVSGSEIRDRELDNATCLSMPTEAEHVLAVNATGPSERLAYYSNYGTEQTTVAAPGGDSRDLNAGVPAGQTTVLAAYPANVLKDEGLLNKDGTPTVTSVIADCSSGTCAYWRYLQGTSMAAPHAVGVLALIISEYGHKDGQDKGGLTLNPVQSEKILKRTAQEHACPSPRTVEYVKGFSATCEGSTEFNGFYGSGIVNALAAVTSKKG